jgi:glutathione reductase (NADPH)
MDKLATEGVQFHMNENTTVIKEQGDNYTVSTESGLEFIH